MCTRGFLRNITIICLVFAWLSGSAQITQTVKGGQTTQPINFPGGCSYHWVNDNPSIGLPAEGDGDIPSFTAINDGNGPITANIKATPVSLGMAYIPSFNDRNVSVVDIAAQKLIKTIGLNDQPYGACVSPDGRFVYVVNGYVVSVISTITNTVTGTIATNAYGYDVVISPDGTKLYFVDGNNDQILVFDTATYALIKSVPCGHFPLGLAINSDGSRIYVADENVDNRPDADAVTVISTSDYSIVATIRIGADTHPWGIAVSPDGKKVYSGNNSLTLGVIDAVNNRLIKRVNIPGENLFGVVVSPDGSKIYVTNEGHYVTVVSAATNSVINQIALPGRGTGLALSADGTLLCVEAKSALICISVAAGKIVSTIKTSASNPNALANFISKGVTCDPVTVAIIVNSSKGPLITGNGSLSPLGTTYGTPSQPETFTVSGKYMKDGILVKAPDGFEVSSDNVNFSNTITVGGRGEIVTTIVYVRLAAVTPAGNHQGDIILTSTEANTETIKVPLSMVKPAQLTVKVKNQTKVYGELLTGAANSTDFSVDGFQNAETAGFVTIAYGEGAATDAAPGNYAGSVKPGLLTGGTFNANNYEINYKPADIMVNKASLTITADDKAIAYNAALPLFTFTFTGFVNDEGREHLIEQPVATTLANENSPPGKYPITVDGAQSDDYEIKYVAGTLTISSLNPALKIPNTFTPNGDGINDTWDIADLEVFPGCTVDIFTRYGTKIYSSIGYSIPWTGRTAGSDLPVGTYYYIIDLKNGTKPYSGSITLLR